MATKLELAKMSGAVYGEPLNLAGWERVEISHENTVDYYGEAYLNKASGEIVIANRGTRPTSPKDLLNDLKLTAHIATAAQDNAAAFAIQVALKYPDAKITETLARWKQRGSGTRCPERPRRRKRVSSDLQCSWNRRLSSRRPYQL